MLQAVQGYAFAVGIPRLEKGVKELKLALKQRMGGSKVELNEYMKLLGRRFGAMLLCSIGLGAVVCYTEIISPCSLY